MNHGPWESLEDRSQQAVLSSKHVGMLVDKCDEIMGKNGEGRMVDNREGQGKQ